MAFTRAEIRCVLTIAGSDSIGGTGMQADLKTLLSHRVHGTVAVTCVTAQDTTGVKAIQRLPAELVGAQIVAVLEDLAPEAVKVGFLGGMEAIEAVASLLDRLPPPVIDPVCVNWHGQPFLPEGTVAAMCSELFPHALLITPNIAEAALLTGREVRSREEMMAAALLLLEMGPRAVLVKGGRLGGADSPDLLVMASGELLWLETARVATTALHGTGDTLSSAVAARMAWGAPLPEAVRLAKEYVVSCLHAALEIGSGQGPIGHVPAARWP